MSETTRTTSTDSRAMSLVLLALAIALGAFLGSAGWASHLPDVDTVPYVHDVGELVRHGTLPVLGNVQSFGGFNPPGDTYLFLPGALLFRDVRLWELPSAIAFYVALVVGVRLLLGRLIAPTPATLAACGFALSAGAIETAGTLWTRMQSPAFLTWTLLFLTLWADRRQAWWLAAALATWFASLYVFPETLLAGVFFPIVWLLRRPPIRVAPIAVTLVVGIALAWPFLAYESRHGFEDLVRIVTQEKRTTDDVRAIWCDPTRTLVELGDDGQPRPATPRPTIVPASRAGHAVGKLAAIASVGALGFTRNGPAGVAIGAAFVIACIGTLRGAAADRPARFEVAFILVGVACVTVALVSSLTLVRAAVGDAVHLTPAAILRFELARAALALIGIASLAGPLRAFVVPPLRDDALALVAWPTLATFAATLAMATPGGQARVWQLWPLLVVVALAGVDRWLRVTTRLNALPRNAIVAAVAGGLVINGSIVARAEQVARDGWSGLAAPEVALLDVVAASGALPVRLGVHVATSRYEFYAPFTDARARVGAGGDAYLLNRYGIANRTRCVEGLSDADEWRIVGPPERDEQVVSTRPGEYAGWRVIAEAPPLKLLRRP